MIAPGDRRTCGYEFVQPPNLFEADCCLNIRELAVQPCDRIVRKVKEALIVAFPRWPGRPVVPERCHRLCEIRAAGGHHPSFAGGDQLSRVKAEHGGITEA